MKNVTLSIDEQLLEQSREYARQQGTTLNALIRQLLQLQVRPASKESPFKELWELADKANGRSAGPWKREDLYER